MLTNVKSLKPIASFSWRNRLIGSEYGSHCKLNDDQKKSVFSKEIKSVPLVTETGIEDIATKFEQEYVRCVRNEEECVCSAPNCCDTEQRSANQW
jgi:hypothetical protein